MEHAFRLWFKTGPQKDGSTRVSGVSCKHCSTQRRIWADRAKSEVKEKFPKFASPNPNPNSDRVLWKVGWTYKELCFHANHGDIVVRALISVPPGRHSQRRQARTVAAAAAWSEKERVSELSREWVRAGRERAGRAFLTSTGRSDFRPSRAVNSRFLSAVRLMLTCHLTCGPHMS